MKALNILIKMRYGAVALSAKLSGYVAAQNVELTCMRLAQLKNSYLFEKVQKI